ncbi:autophagy-related protein 18g-like isoform X2 [Magnolia sinica]|uniref:autophagy-related protein 18g-like isoform X2 n=1 Tax=Magnolia sinica TaxID=86752 RepID=UPI00265AA40F|nr:autophagy-related protein 18g-like isoform X2 [Magnolia sinica]
MRKGKGSGKSSNISNGLLPNSLKIISSCLKTVSTDARSAGATVAASIAAAGDHPKDQVIWAGFDKLELGPSAFRHVLLLGYSNGFQVIDVEDASNVCELVSKRDGQVTFLQMLPIPSKSEAHEGFRSLHPLLLVVAGDEANSSGGLHGGHLSGQIRENISESHQGIYVSTPSTVRFYSLRSDGYVHVLRFRSAIYMIRCSPRIIAVALASQIYCFDAATFENKFSVLTYPMPQGGQGVVGVNIGYGPMAVGPRWLAYASNNPLFSNTGRLSPQNLTPSPGMNPSTSPSSGSFVARCAMESSKQLAAGIINLGDIGYRTLSKYCQELLPDGSNSPSSSNSSWKVGKVESAVHPNETDNAGMVVVKDFVSKAIISQFRAHTSPISALCFDPSGTLLVTASVHGHNINVFRIMPSRVENRSSTMQDNWSSSHVHLYRLYRGLTTAVIQDICFSHHSQWVAIVSSRGTCHIFVLSQFGGDVGLQTQSFHTDAPVLPILSKSWWSTPSYMINQLPHPPPPPITLSVVSRIKYGSSAWLNTVTNVVASATGKIFVPSCAVAAAFHDSIHHNLQPVRSKANSLEQLLVYSSSGHVIQHELVPSLEVESWDSTARSGPGSSMPAQYEELRVNAEPVQWWDVCRRSNWPEREESLSSITFDRQETGEIVMETSDYEDNDTKYSKSFNNSVVGKNMMKTSDRSHWYLSNAEVRISSGRIPIWQNTKVCFYMMISSKANERKPGNDYSGGEIKIEKVPVHEVEIRQKDLLPVFEHHQSIQPDWNGRGLIRGRYMIASTSDTHQTKDKFMKGTVVGHSKSASVEVVESLDIGSTKTTEKVLRLDQTSLVGPYVPNGFQPMERPILHGSVQTSSVLGHLANKIDGERTGRSMSASHQLNTSTRTPSINSSDQDCTTFLFEQSNKGDGSVENEPTSPGNSSLSVGRPLSLKKVVANEALKASSSNHSASSSNNYTVVMGRVGSHNSPDFAKYFHEGYCKVTELDDCCELNDVVTDVDSSISHCKREKPKEDRDHDDVFGGLFVVCGED